MRSRFSSQKALNTFTWSSYVVSMSSPQIENTWFNTVYASNPKMSIWMRKYYFYFAFVRKKTPYLLVGVSFCAQVMFRRYFGVLKQLLGGMMSREKHAESKQKTRRVSVLQAFHMKKVTAEIGFCFLVYNLCRAIKYGRSSKITNCSVAPSSNFS